MPSAADTLRRRLASERGAVLVSVLLAFAVRLAHAACIADTPFFDGPVIDAWTYRRWAEQIAARGELGGAFYQPPLYAIVQAIWIRLGAGHGWWLASLHAALGATSVGLLAAIGGKLARRLGGPPIGVSWACGMCAALYGPLVLYDLEWLPPALVHVLLLAAWRCSLVERARPGWIDAAGGVLGGLACTAWAPSAILVLGLPSHRRSALTSRAARGVCVAVWLLAAGVPIACTAAYNARHDAPGVLISFNAGLNFWLGNNPHWRETWRARPGAEFEPELERPDREGVIRPADKSRYFLQLGWQYVTAQPSAAAARTLEKFYYAWHGREIRRNQDLAYLRERSEVLHALMFDGPLFFPFGVLAPLALAGLWRRRSDWDARVIGLSVLAYALVLAVFFVSARYRLPVALWLMPIAVSELATLVRDWRRPGLTVGLLVALNLPVAFTATFAADALEREILEANALRHRGDVEAATRRAADLALRYPEDANAQMLWAEALYSNGECAHALRPLQRVIARAPRTTTPRVMLAECLEQGGDFAGAERAYAAALAVHPYHVRALQGAAALYRRSGDARATQVLLERLARH